MTRGGLLRRLEDGWVANHRYAQGVLRGMVSAWRHQGRFVLTWEECRDGDQSNENRYTRDERHRFAAAEAVLEFLEQAGYPASRFGP